MPVVNDAARPPIPARTVTFPAGRDVRYRDRTESI
jgi:hypothetical protein